MKMSKVQLQQEFRRQTKTLIDKGYHIEAGITENELLGILALLEEKLYSLSVAVPDLEIGYLPFVLVVKNSFVSTAKAMELVKRHDKKGITKLFPHTPKDFKVAFDIDIPKSNVYLLVDIDRGKDNINLAPIEAIELIKNSKRTPLTIDEGVAIITQFPNFLMKNNCFSLLASRTGKDKRVPAIWINQKREPNLGWCWDGNPHTWLGSASCRIRLS